MNDLPDNLYDDTQEVSLREIDLPDHLTSISDLAECFRAGEREAYRLERELTAIHDDILVTTSTERGLERREKILGLKPLASDSDDDRRTRIKLYWYDIYPYTLKTLRIKLRALPIAYHDLMDVVVSYDDEHQPVLTLNIFPVDDNTMRIIEEMFEKVLPLNVIYKIKFIYTTYGYIKDKKYTYGALHSKTLSQVMAIYLKDAKEASN